MNYSHRKIGSRLHIFAPRQIRGSHPLLPEDVDRSSYGNLMPPFPLSLTGVARQYSGASSLCFRQDVYQLSQDMTQHGSHPGLLANQTPSDQYCRPIRDKLRLRRLGTDCLYVWYCFVVSMLWILILNICWIKCVSDSLCLYQRSEVNPELPRT